MISSASVVTTFISGAGIAEAHANVIGAGLEAVGGLSTTTVT